MTTAIRLSSVAATRTAAMPNASGRSACGAFGGSVPANTMSSGSSGPMTAPVKGSAAVAKRRSPAGCRAASTFMASSLRRYGTVRGELQRGAGDSLGSARIPHALPAARCHLFQPPRVVEQLSYALGERRRLCGQHEQCVTQQPLLAHPIPAHPVGEFSLLRGGDDRPAQTCSLLVCGTGLSEHDFNCVDQVAECVADECDVQIAQATGRADEAAGPGAELDPRALHGFAYCHSVDAGGNGNKGLQHAAALGEQVRERAQTPCRTFCIARSIAPAPG